MLTDIRFGTDGWRGIIADDYTFENVRRVAAGIAEYVCKNEDPKRGVLVAYDTRFGSRKFAEAAAERLAQGGIPVKLANDYTPTPALSFQVKRLGAAGGVMITSSHNPWNWNGVKFKAKFGGSGTPAMMKEIEDYVRHGADPKAPGGSVAEFDFMPEYIANLKAFADVKKIGAAGYKVAVDCMYGAGRNVLAGIFAELGVPCVQIRSEVNPLFPGINPEPIEPHVRALQETVVKEKCHGGFVTDGDADRVGAVTEDGMFVDAHKCYAILLRWLLEFKQWPGAVTRAFNTTCMLDRIAQKHGRELIEHGIGFKFITDLVLSGREILIGGEESGGIGIPRYLPERDGLMNSLLIANAMADHGRTLGQLVAELQKEFGEHHYGRVDMHIANDVKQAAIARAVDKGTTTLGPFKVTRKADLDGIKFFLDAPRGDTSRNISSSPGAEAWVLMRASGTEPLLRVYSEAASPELVKQILGEAKQFVEQSAPAAMRA